MSRGLPFRWILLLGAAAAAATTADADTVTVRTDVVFLGADREEKVDVYLPPGWAATDRRPGIVWIHGGGWLGGDKAARREVEVCTELAKAGFVCVSVNYRLGDGAWPGNLEDCRDGVRFLRARAGTWGVDAGRIGVAGASAGGHLALMVAYAAGEVSAGGPGEGGPSVMYPDVSSSVSCVVNLYGITDLRDRRRTEVDGTPTDVRRAGGPARVFGTDDPAADIFRRASPVEHVGSLSPPTLILHGRADTTADYGQAIALVRALERHGVPHQVLMIDGVGHSFDLDFWRDAPLPVDAKSVVLRFLLRHLGAPPQPVAFVNDEPVTIREFVEAMRRLRSRFREPAELRRAALTECVRFAVTLQLARAHQLLDEVSELAMRQAFARENQRRARAAATGAVFHGPRQLTWEQFRAVWLDRLHYDLARALPGAEADAAGDRLQMRPQGGVESVERAVEQAVQSVELTTNDALLRALDATTPLPAEATF